MIKQVVSVAFIKDGKLLTVQSVRSSQTNAYTMIGGGVEEGETLGEAAVREVKEEIRNGFFITEDDLEPILHFTEQAESDPDLKIELHIFICHKEIDVELIPNEEILKHHWYGPNDIDIKVTTAIRDHFMPYARAKELLY